MPMMMMMMTLCMQKCGEIPVRNAVFGGHKYRQDAMKSTAYTLSN